MNLRRAIFGPTRRERAEEAAQKMFESALKFTVAVIEAVAAIEVAKAKRMGEESK